MTWTLIKLGEKHKQLNIVNILFEILQEKNTQEFILDLNRKDQLFDKGINSEGQTLESIGGGYSPVTEIINQNKVFSYKGSSKKKIAGESPFLFDTEDFYKSFKVFVTKSEIRIDADPNKDGINLFFEWGEEIVGLTEGSIDKLRQYVLPLIQQKVLRILNDIQ